MLDKKIENILQNVQKPGRYTGGELGSVMKDKNEVDIRYAFCFPDTYEIGMSHIGMKILYSLVNEREDSWCERVFAPWIDMEEQMRANNIPLYALESGDPIKDFDIVGFTLQYELCYTNVLNMLDLAGIPIYAKDRTELAPLIIAGGPCVCNSEPMADFFDLTLPGEGEEVTNELIDLLKECKKLGKNKQEFLKEAVKIEGVYAPSMYELDYNSDGTIESVTPLDGAPQKVKKRIISDLDNVFYPEKFVVPFIEVVHDRTVAEIFRGCTRGCRFCQAGFLYRPIREKNPETINIQSKKLCDVTGYDEISLCSLSTSDYSNLPNLLEEMLNWTVDENINISLPSLRADNFSTELVTKLNKVRRSGLTFAAEAGTQRLRDAINKNITEEDIMSATEKALENGWTSVKLYYMIGLPTETEEDVIGIAELSQRVVNLYYNSPNRQKGKGINVNISVASFVPKPFTPFQWEPQDTLEMMIEKQNLIKNSITTKKINVGWHKPSISFLEGVFARGDRKLSKVIETAWRKGCKFDGWDDQFKFDLWMEAFEECEIKPEFYANRRRSYDEILPWDHMDYGIPKDFFIKENKKAYSGVTTPQCREKCNACMANLLNGGKCDAML